MYPAERHRAGVCEGGGWGGGGGGLGCVCVSMLPAERDRGGWL